jgi:hypothetical protein
MVFAFAGDSTITRLLPISEICILGEKSVSCAANRKLAVKSVGYKYNLAADMYRLTVLQGQE